jgi:hypothetical protein
MNKKSLQIVEPKKLKQGYTPIKVTNLKNAKRLLSKLIYELQAGTIDNQTAKDLTYLLVSFVNVFKPYEMEKRVSEIERMVSL